MDIIFLILALWGCTMLTSMADSLQRLAHEVAWDGDDDEDHDEREAA